MSARLAIRADGGAGVGAGHVMRCVALADGWRRAGGGVEWFCKPLPPMLGDLLSSRSIAAHSIGGGDEWSGIAAWAAAHPDAWVAIDGYDFAEGAARLKASGIGVMVVDDDGRWPFYDCDVLLNQNAGAEHVAYRTPASARRLLGPDYVLLRDEFRRLTPAPRRFDRPAERVFVGFGGHDRHGQARRVTRLLKTLSPSVQIDVAGGLVADLARDVARDFSPATAAGVVFHTTSDLSRVMNAADMAVVAAGSICWELAYLGVPFLTMVVASNQEAVARRLHDAGIARTLGWYDRISGAQLAAAIEELRADPARGEMSRRGMALVDGKGADRVVRELRRLRAGAEAYTS